MKADCVAHKELHGKPTLQMSPDLKNFAPNIYLPVLGTFVGLGVIRAAGTVFSKELEQLSEEGTHGGHFYSYAVINL